VSEESTPSASEAEPEAGSEAPPDAAETAFGEAEQAIEDARRRLSEAPAEMVVTNHVMGLYELAAIHLSATPPNLPAASLAIDAVGSLVEGLGDRLGEDSPTLRDALANIRMAFVAVKSATVDGSGKATDLSGDDAPATDDDSLGSE
jgi:hypothetical protein